jgi:hypothetical protein
LTTLAKGLSSPHGIAVHAGQVYWADDVNPGTVMTVPTGGGNVSTLVSGLKAPGFVVADDTSVYFTNYMDSTVMKAAVDGGSPTTLATGLDPRGIAVGSIHVFWADFSQHTIMSVPISGGAAMPLASALKGPTRITLRDGIIYFIDQDEVMEVSTKGGAFPTSLAPMQSQPWDIATDGVNVYWTNAGDGTVKSVPIGGGTVQLVAKAQAMPGPIAVDSTSVYWINLANGLGALMKVPK